MFKRSQALLRNNFEKSLLNINNIIDDCLKNDFMKERQWKRWDEAGTTIRDINK